MTHALTFVWWVSFAALAYVYVGYPAGIALLVRVRGARPVRRDAVLRPVSLVISAYNEAAVIRQKIENALSLDYPSELLEIVVISDASSDGTDDIVRDYARRGVTLHVQPARRGKTAGLNRTVPALRGEIVVFTDANAMFEPAALRRLVRNFGDPDVGCVTGEARYVKGAATAADVGERMYWNYEIQLKRLETAMGSMVGGDGAIYAIRKELWQELPETAINDFLNPLQIVSAGWRAVYEPEAVCFEETAGGIGREYRRRIRIISRSLRAIFQAPAVLNPFRVGFFAVSIVSHKLLRWLSAFFMGAAIAGGAPIVVGWAGASPAAAAAAIAVAAVAAAALRPGRRAVALAAYFVAMNVASLAGVVKGTLGRVSGTWSTPREAAGGGRAGGGRLRFLAAALVAVGGMAALGAALSRALTPAAVLFWTTAAVLVYVYAGYPAALAIMRRTARRPVRREPVEPTVCLFVAANDEEAVIAKKIRNSLMLDYPPDRLQIVVASDGSVDRTNEIVRSFAGSGVRLIAFPKRRGKMAAINAGVPAVDAEVIVFSDANTLLQRGALRALVRGFADPQVGVVSGDVCLIGERAALAASEDLYYRYERWLQRVESEIGSMIGVDGALYAIRRRLFQPPPDHTILDDLAIPMAAVRAGYRAVFEPEATAFEHGSRSASEEFSRKIRIVAGAVQFLARRESFGAVVGPQVLFSLVSHKVLRWLSPALVLVSIVASLALAPQSTFYASLLFVEAALGAAGVMGCLPRLRRLKPIGMAHYFCLVHAAAAVGLVRGVLGQQSAAWRRFPRVPLEQAPPAATGQVTPRVAARVPAAMRDMSKETT
jgi:cellulose synthase/poly-beta-1,6-N-acetylglucosamine synthase-like glycosyltransferase